MKTNFLSLALILALTAQLIGCGSFPSEAAPSVVPEAPAASTASATEQAEKLEALEGAERTEKGNYYKKSEIKEDIFLSDPLPDELDAAAAADLCQTFIEMTGFDSTGFVWEMRRASHDPAITPVIWYGTIPLPPLISEYPLIYNGSIEQLDQREVYSGISICINAFTGELMHYSKVSPDPFQYQIHTEEEYAAYAQAEMEWKLSEEYRQILLDGCAAMNIGAVKELRLLNPDTSDPPHYLAILENGDCWFVNATYHDKTFSELSFSEYYFNGEAREG